MKYGRFTVITISKKILWLLLSFSKHLELSCCCQLVSSYCHCRENPSLKEYITVNTTYLFQVVRAEL